MGLEPGVAIHSRYDPAREAERFVAALDAPPEPRFVVVTEPGDSWLAAPLRTRFPRASLIALRYTPDVFRDSDCRWDFVWRPGESSPAAFLLRHVQDDDIPLTVFAAWKPSDRAWPGEARAVWEGIAESVRVAGSVMRTRTGFGPRWLANLFSGPALADRPSSLDPFSYPVILAAAGPSLERWLPLDGSRFFTIAVSAAVGAIAAAGESPDLCVATDGGFWARAHLDRAPGGMPIAIPPEAALPRRAAAENPIVFLSYGSPLERELFERCGIRPLPARRNGTVAGTACELAFSLSPAHVYACGLDLAPSSSYSHARPNAFDASTDAATDRLQPLATELARQNAESGALSVYADWFASRDAGFKSRLFRLGPVAREIPGVDVIDRLPDSHATIAPAAKRSLVRAQPCPPRAARARAAADLARSLARELDVADSRAPSDRLVEALLSKTSLSDLAQLASYGDYIALVRKTGGGDGPEVSAIVSSIASRVGAAVDRVARRLDRDG